MLESCFKFAIMVTLPSWLTPKSICRGSQELEPVVREFLPPQQNLEKYPRSPRHWKMLEKKCILFFFFFN